MSKLTSGVFENLEITSPMDADKRIAYTQRILRGAALKKYKAVLTECKESAKELEGYHVKALYIERLWTWSKGGGLDDKGDSYLGLDKCVKSDKELWFELGKCMWIKHRRVL